MRQFILIILVISSLSASAQTPMRMLIPKKASGGSITPPSFSNEYETAWNTTTSPKTTGTVSVNNGDVIVAFCIAENHQMTATISNTGTALTWTQQQVSTTTNLTYISVWTATATSTTTFTVSFTRSGSAVNYGGNVLVFSGSSGIGASNKNTGSSAAPTVSLTTTSANSAVVAANGDWNALSTSRTWRTVNSITPTSGNGLEKTYQNVGSNYTVYGAYWNNVGAAGANNYGLSAPSTQNYAIVAVEVKGQ